MPAGPRVGSADAVFGRATRADIDLDALAGNVRRLDSRLAPGCGLMAVVKADGYGHGAVEVGRAALAAGAAALAVATVGEGAALRRAGITAPVLALSAIDAAEAPAAIALGLDLTVGTLELLGAISEAARSLDLPRPPAVHVKVDSGMRRYGARPDLAVALARRIAADPALRLAGLSTHFAAADEPDEQPTADQAAVLDRVRAELADYGIVPEVVHAANSAAALRSPRFHYGMARVGIALYGLPPSPETALPPGLRPVMSLHSRVTRVLALDPGDGVGYGLTYRAAAPERAALIPIGYGDGYRRALSGKGWMGIQGRPAPVIGRVSMDQTVVRLGPEVTVAVGDEVVVVGGEGTGAPSVAEVAALLDTIPYEVVVGIMPRVPRIYRTAGATA